MSIVAFIGLGIMGSPMAVNVQRAGHHVQAHNRSSGRAGPLVEAGGSECPTVAEAVRGASVVCLMLPDSPDVQAVMTGEDGVLAHAAEGAVVVDFSTIRPDVARELAQEAETRGLRMLDAPVSGGEAGARDGSLSVMVGGPADAVQDAGEVLRAVGRTVVHVGPAGAGQTVKAANQLMVAGHLQVLAEAVVFLEASGVELGPALEVIAGGLAGSRVLESKAEGMAQRAFEPGFRTELHHKDLGILEDAAREASVVVPVGALLAQLMASAVANGDGALDHSALLRGVLRLSGRA
ncbi:NAD(P)-dependent oxidoreductase [Ornithinimicrobium pekingense]|uniref:2-hydroxy-3-oxopropionate reductase n=1 Tax=Ornithinimicrobium pekingense TaxID=384677 RepID=A0ABQ2FBB6_9MICO|nr:NAD(P)-dependent oxidoreductase [Ornithinimicrobium pekingense]GGK80272.1 2-hydroxy-3-oxopropionate reductase [Ornithinimicrobium pekingense]